MTHCPDPARTRQQSKRSGKRAVPVAIEIRATATGR